MRVYSFKDVIGNFGTVSMIKSSVRNGSFPNFSLMSGDSGTGKSTCAEIVALALNCENRVDENPCLHCDSCRRNLATLQGKGISSRVKKINVAHYNGRKDVDNIINEIFRLEVGSGNSVFILEEVHSLEEPEQTALLEEIDKLDKNVYVILCTTRPRKLLEELRNRAIKFNFSSLKSTDSRILLDKLLGENNYVMPENIKDIILKQSRGVPRRIVNLLDFLKSNPCNYSDILSFLGEIDPKSFNLLFRSSYDFSSYLTALNELISDYSIDDVVVHLKKYLLDLHFLASGVSTYYSNTSQDDKKVAMMYGKECIYKIQTIIHGLGYNIDEPDFMFAMFKVRNLLVKYDNTNTNSNDINPSTGVIADTRESSIKESSSFSDSVSVTSSAIENNINAVEKRDMIKNSTTPNLNKLSFDKLKEMLKDES